MAAGMKQWYLVQHDGVQYKGFPRSESRAQRRLVCRVQASPLTMDGMTGEVLEQPVTVKAHISSTCSSFRTLSMTRSTHDPIGRTR